MSRAIDGLILWMDNDKWAFFVACVVVVAGVMYKMWLDSKCER